ncbi:cohesin domain-containing protein [Paenibacillus sp. EC2-1]|uniref:cohesin domain-containing protein n=1 Tax=Paenibacillus sp. EC2-1 TaxID=3388665 RepID=UPI003BEF3B12
MRHWRQGVVWFSAFILMVSSAFTFMEVREVDAAAGFQIKEVKIPNAGFEEEVTNSVIPGWTPLWKPYEDAYYEITTDRAYSGKQSVRFKDTSTTKGAILQSAALPVKPGIEYTASAMMYLEEPTVAATLLLRFYDENNKQVGTDSLFHYRTPKNEWFKAEIKGLAPANAKYASVFASLSNFFTAVAYYDDFKLTYEQKDMNVTLQAPATATKGTSITVKVGVSDAVDLYAADLNLIYDPNVLKVTDVVLDPEFEHDQKAFLTWKAKDGRLRIITSQLQSQVVNGNKGIANVTFQVLDQTGNTTLTIEQGSILAPAHAQTDDELVHLLNDVKARMTILDSMEDLNRDGVVNLIDLLLIAKKLDEKPAGSILHYDLNGDGYIDVTDLGLVAQVVLKN